MHSPQESDRRRASFGSADSFAGGLASPVALSRAPSLLLTFAILALLQLWIFQLGHFEGIFQANDYVIGPYVGFTAISIRIFMLSFFVAFSIFAAGTVRARVLFCLDLCLRYIALCVLWTWATSPCSPTRGRRSP